MPQVFPPDDEAFARLLFDSAKLDRTSVSRSDRRRIAAHALTVASAASSVTWLTAARAIAATSYKGVAGHASMLSLKLAGGSFVAKCVIGGVCIAAASAGTYNLISERSSASAPAVEARASARPHAKVILAQGTGDARGPETPLNPATNEAPLPMPSVVAGLSAPLSVGSGVVAETQRRANVSGLEQNQATLNGEVRALDKVRRALATGDGQGALEALDDYQRAFPNGGLIPEATYLRVQALRKVGNVSAAHDVATRALATWPDNPKSNELRAFINASPQ
jgi:hypothetical protein